MSFFESFCSLLLRLSGSPVPRLAWTKADGLEVI